MADAAITDPALCTNVGGMWKQPECSVSSQLACGEHGGQWQPAKQWTLQGGVDLLIVGLLQVPHNPMPFIALSSHDYLFVLLLCWEDHAEEVHCKRSRCVLLPPPSRARFVLNGLAVKFHRFAAFTLSASMHP